MKTQKKETVCIIGLGYVGLPLAVQSALKGYKVYGLDMDTPKIEKINAGKNPIDKEEFLDENLPKVKIQATNNPKIIKKANIVIVCVPTPIDEKHYPDLRPVKGAVNSIIENMGQGQMVILESTINPGISEEIVEPMFAKAGKKVNKDYHLAHCPERINPGDKNWNVTNIPRVVGAFGKIGLSKAVKFYEDIIDAEIHPMKSIREAEAVKIVENSFRDVNIAFVNELAKSFAKLDIDVVDVIKGASTKPFAFMPHFPSCGVGGHCIPVDPYYLIERAKISGFDHEFLRTAREINNSMPAFTVEILQDALNRIKMPLNGTVIGVLGLSYKANVADLRETPSFRIIKALEVHGAKAYTYDPYFPTASKARSLNDLLKKSHALVIATDHDHFKDIDPKMFKKHNIKVIVDGKNCLDKKAIEKHKIVYRGIGR